MKLNVARGGGLLSLLMVSTVMSACTAPTLNVGQTPVVTPAAACADYAASLTAVEARIHAGLVGKEEATAQLSALKASPSRAQCESK